MARTGRPRTASRIQCTCEQCGKVWTRASWDKTIGKYCSRVCYHRGRTGKGKPIVTPLERSCPECGTKFLVGGAGRRRWNSTYCSRQCSAKHRWLELPGHERAREMSDTESAWFAGVFDGEGCIVWPVKTNIKSVRLSVANTCVPLLEKVRVVSGTGKVRMQQARKSRFHTQPWIWDCYGENARIVLRQIVPWLIVKKEAAEVALGIVVAATPPLTQRTKTIMAARAAEAGSSNDGTSRGHVQPGRLQRR